MEIYEYSSDVKPSFSAAVVALGLFDGVHLGHRALLATAKAEAEKRGLPLVVFTFFSENELPKGATRLYSTEQKNELLKKAGAEYVVYADFGKIANLSAKSFVFDVLVDKLKAQLTVAGLDFRFGKGREGDAQTLAALMAERGGKCLLVPDESAFGAKVSTSLIKDLLKRGEPELAGKLLGEPYFIEGTIVRGDGRGRTLGLTTVNIYLPSDNSFIKHGVFC